MTGTNGLAGYLQPGSRVDVYANITKVSTSSGAQPTLPLPCTELAMADIQVLDVAEHRARPSPATGLRPAGPFRPETLLLAVSPGQARTIEFLSQNETLSVVQTQKDANAPPLQQCIGTDQTTGAP